MEQTLWTLALLPALLNPQLYPFQDWFRGNGTSETQGCNSTEIKTIHPPMQILENSFSQHIVRTQPQALSGERETPLPAVDTSLPPITMVVNEILADVAQADT